MRVAIITAIYDDYDDLKPTMAQQGIDVEWICVTDRAREGNGWRVVVEPRPGQHPNVAAKRPKMLPWEYTEANFSIWMDASFLVKSSYLALQMTQMVSMGPIAQFRHPWRDCVYDEAEASLQLPKYQGLPVAEQMAQYRAWGHPEHWGLWSTGFIVREHTASVKLLGERWLRTCQEWSFQDQLSEAVHLRLVGLTPNELPGCHTGNNWVDYHGSHRH